MDINYNIIWFEDTDEWYDTVSSRLQKYIQRKNLKPNIVRIKNVNDFNVSDFDFNKYEMIIIDYQLENNTFGQEIIKTIRAGKYVNDVLFYSSNGYTVISDVMKKEGLQGVFMTDRANAPFLEMAQNLVDKSLRRSENLVNIRGIVMDSTSAFDDMIKDIISIGWSYLGDKEDTIIKYIKNDLLNNYKKSCEQFINKYEDINNSNIDQLLNERDFTSYMKIRLLNKCINVNATLKETFAEVYLPYFKDETSKNGLHFFEKYNKDITNYRNALAHVKKSSNSDGDILIGSKDGVDVVFDSELCYRIRKNLIKYENLLDNMYKAIEKM